MSRLTFRPVPRPAASRPRARFDDLVDGIAYKFPTCSAVLVAETPDDVCNVLAEVDRATKAGAWSYGFVGYEAASGLDPGLATHSPDPDLGLVGGSPPAWFAVTEEPVRVPCIAASQSTSSSTRWMPDWTDDQHATAVEAVGRAIAAGETYQCNLTDRLRASTALDPVALYAKLCHAQHGRYNALIDLGSHAVVSASPELFFEWSDSSIRTRPMKGTAARHANPSADHQAAEQLWSSPKERAENLMIVDLLRNDLAWIARTGTVSVSELFTVERYPTVWQMVSEIVAEPHHGASLVDVFRALFPCGSVTGAPKRRTMELIRDLEPHPRGIYCGAIGMVAPPSHGFRARFSVAIRTAVVGELGSVYGAGGAVTWDSRADAERRELLVKAKLLS